MRDFSGDKILFSSLIQVIALGSLTRSPNMQEEGYEKYLFSDWRFVVCHARSNCTQFAQSRLNTRRGRCCVSRMRCALGPSATLNTRQSFILQTVVRKSRALRQNNPRWNSKSRCWWQCLLWLSLMKSQTRRVCWCCQKTTLNKPSQTTTSSWSNSVSWFLVLSFCCKPAAVFQMHKFGFNVCAYNEGKTGRRPPVTGVTWSLNELRGCGKKQVFQNSFLRPTICCVRSSLQVTFAMYSACLQRVLNAVKLFIGPHNVTILFAALINFAYV